MISRRHWINSVRWVEQKKRRKNRAQNSFQIVSNEPRENLMRNELANALCLIRIFTALLWHTHNSLFLFFSFTHSCPFWTIRRANFFRSFTRSAFNLFSFLFFSIFFFSHNLDFRCTKSINNNKNQRKMNCWKRKKKKARKKLTKRKFLHVEMWSTVERMIWITEFVLVLFLQIIYFCRKQFRSVLNRSVMIVCAQVRFVSDSFCV